MLHAVKNKNLVNKRIAFSCGLMAAAVFALLPISLQAQCAQWDAGGQWELQQSNGFTYRLDLRQTGKEITGSASYSTITAGTNVLGVRTGGDPVTRTASVSGNIEGDDFYVTIGTAGIYRGKVGPSGRMDGITYDANHTSSKATWFSTRAMTCAPIPESAPPRPKPITRSGKARSETVAPPLNPPFITAGPPIRIPFVPGASVYLGWDGGPDHPAAEVWVSINNAAEISAALLYGTALKQPKVAAIELKLQGGVYKYFLKDAGTTLSTVVVVVP